jgi:hypothetical protein
MLGFTYGLVSFTCNVNWRWRICLRCGSRVGKTRHTSWPSSGRTNPLPCSRIAGFSYQSLLLYWGGARLAGRAPFHSMENEVQPCLEWQLWNVSKSSRQQTAHQQLCNQANPKKNTWLDRHYPKSITMYKIDSILSASQSIHDRHYSKSIMMYILDSIL